MRVRVRTRLMTVTALAVALAAGTASATPAGAREPFVGPLNTVSTIASTVPANGDLNPYGVAVVRHSDGDLHRGNVLVSNFNNGLDQQGVGNQQGRGTTLVQVSPDGTVQQFAQIDPANLPGPCPGGVGLTTALSILWPTRPATGSPRSGTH